MAEAYRSNSDVSYGGFKLGGATVYRQSSPYGGSAVYNYRRTGAETGFSPFYAKLPQNKFSSHMRIRNSLDYAVYTNPDLLQIRYSTNPHRQLQGFNDNKFELFHARGGKIDDGGYTGRVRSFLGNERTNNGFLFLQG